MASTKNYLAGAAQSLIFGFSFFFTKSVLVPDGTIRSYELLFLRFLAAALLMTALVAFRVIKVDFRGKKLGPLALTALLQPVLYFLAETEGVKLIDTSTTGIILSAIPVVVAFLAGVLLKERMSLPQILMMLLSFAGVLIISFFRATGLGGSVPGFLLIGLAMVLAAFYNIASRKASATFTAAETTFFMMWFGAIVFGLVFAGSTVASGEFDLFARMTGKAWLSVAYLGVLSSVVAFFCVNYNLSKLKAPEAAVFANLTTVVSVIAGVALLGETISFWDISGGVLILVGIWGTNTLRRRSPAAPADASAR